FGRAGAGDLLDRIGDEGGHRAVAHPADPDAALPAIVVLGDRLRFRIRDIDDVVPVDEHAARPAELVPLVEVVAVLIEDLDAIVLPVAEKEPAARIHRDRVRDVDLAGTGTLLAPGLDELAGPVELDDARIGVAAVAVGDEDVAIRRGDDRRRRVELVRSAAGDAGLAERQQHLAVGAELEHLVALAVLADAIGDPDVALAVDV